MEHYFPLQFGGRTIRVQIALETEEVRKGLMHRESLEPDAGMLFVFDEERRMSFWMRNTKIPLDVGYFTADGVLQEVYPLYPLDERAVQSRREDLQLALEMNQGWFKRNQVRPGARIEMGAVKAAIRERGFTPEVFGLE